MIKLIETLRKAAVGVEPWWTLIGAPTIQEFIFRFVPYQLYIAYGWFYGIGIGSSLLFAAIHWYFDKWFILYSLMWGWILWWLMVNYGFLTALTVHAALNIVHLQLGILPRKSKGSLD